MGGMKINPMNRVSVLLVCPPGLEQASLYTTVNAIPQVTVIAKAADAAAALQLTQQHNPDVLLADAYFLQDEVTQLLRRINELHPEMIRVVVTAAPSQKRRLRQEGADFVLDYGNLNQQFPQILSTVREKYQDRFAP